MLEWLISFYAAYGSVLNFLGINAMLALSLYLTFSAGQLSLGAAAFASIGGYVSGILSIRTGLPYPLALAAGTASAAAVGYLLGRPILRLSGVFLAISTLGFGEMVRIAAVNMDITGGAQGLLGIPTETKTWTIYLALVVCCWFAARLPGSRLGWAMACLRQDEAAARSLGIDAAAVKTAAFTLSAAMAGLAGALNAHLNFLISPGDFGFTTAVNILVFLIVGGTFSWYGPVLGAALMTALPELLRATGITAGPMRWALSGVILLAVILFLPHGLASLFKRPAKRRKAHAATGEASS